MRGPLKTRKPILERLTRFLSCISALIFSFRVATGITTDMYPSFTGKRITIPHLSFARPKLLLAPERQRLLHDNEALLATFH